MKKFNNNKTFPLSVLMSALLLSGCGGSSTESTDNASSEVNEASESTVLTGSFIDAAVEGVEYQTSSGESGVTNEHGQFNYQSGDRVEFRIGQLVLGSTEVGEDGLVTPVDLTEENSYTSSELRQVTLERGLSSPSRLMLRLMQSMDEDKNPANGIKISDTVRAELEQAAPLNLQETPLSETDLLAYDNTLTSTIDHDADGELDVSTEEAESHFAESVENWQNGYRSESGNVENQDGSYIPYVTENHAEYYHPESSEHPAPIFDEENYKVTWFIQANTDEQATNMKRHIDFMASKTHQGATPRAWDKLFLMEAYFASNHNYEVNVTINDERIVEVHKDSDNACSFEATKAHANAVSNDFFGLGDTSTDYSFAAEEILATEACDPYRAEIEAFIENNQQER